ISNGYWMKGAIDNAMVFDRALTADEIAVLYNQGNGTEDLSGGGQYDASYAANGWSFDVNEDFEVKVDFYYSGLSAAEGWTGITIGDDVNYVSIYAGSNGSQPYFYYEAVVDESYVSAQEPRAINDGTLYVSFNSTAKEFYLSHTGFGSEYAYTAWLDPNPTQGEWSEPVKASIGGGSSGAALVSGEACLDNFNRTSGVLLNWPPPTDLDINGYIEINDLAMMCENWLKDAPGDFDNSGLVDLFDLAELGLAW
ncbi:MAG: hypothetical protein JW749_07690, partial [Sedimentisphaerales bacterium]|nr:hypothetical protein [Sedimentisphaerales bacterium]